VTVLNPEREFVNDKIGSCVVCYRTHNWDCSAIVRGMPLAIALVVFPFPVPAINPKKFTTVNVKHHHGE